MIKVSLIPCSEQCAHQEEGFCSCDKAGSFNSSTQCEIRNGCVYYTPKGKITAPDAKT